jgi:hypothetical protein
MNEYLSPCFLKHFELVSFLEEMDPTAEKVSGDNYPGYFVILAKAK